MLIPLPRRNGISLLAKASQTPWILHGEGADIPSINQDPAG
jgi:hypothetical protein